MLSEEQVRKDLREWRKQEHAIKTCLDAKARMERQVQILVDFGKLEEAEKISQQIKMLNIDKLIETAQSKRENYIRAIEQLNNIDKTIIIDSVINGKSYLCLSRELAYSEANIKWRAKNAIKKIYMTLIKQDGDCKNQLEKV